MVLDAPTFKLVLTAESALGVVQKEIHHRGWKNFEVEEVRLIYSPYYLFSFDVKSESGPPVSGKAALNAYTGEISDFVPAIMDRPLQKTKNPEEGGEVEETSISMNEAKQVAKDKIAAQAGLKSEMVVTSAFTKVYVPFFRVWMEVAHNSMRVDVDALMGVPLGIEAAPEREKTWGEATGETLSKLKSPSGWIELTGKTLGSVMGGGGGSHGGDHGGSGGHGDEHGGGHGGGDSGAQRRWLILGGVILLLMYLLFLQPKSNINCTGSLTEIKQMCVVKGSCEITVKKEGDQQGKMVLIFIKGPDGKEIADYQTGVGFFDTKTVSFNTSFVPQWETCDKYGWGYRQIS